MSTRQAGQETRGRPAAGNGCTARCWPRAAAAPRSRRAQLSRSVNTKHRAPGEAARQQRGAAGQRGGGLRATLGAVKPWGDAARSARTRRRPGLQAVRRARRRSTGRARPQPRPAARRQAQLAVGHGSAVRAGCCYSTWLADSGRTSGARSDVLTNCTYVVCHVVSRHAAPRRLPVRFQQAARRQNAPAVL